MNESASLDDVQEALGGADPAALVVIDMQNDFASERGYFGSRRSDMLDALDCDPRQVSLSIPSVSRLLQTFRDTGRKVFHTQMIRDRDEANSVRGLHRIVPKTYQVVVEPGEDVAPPLVPDSWGADLVDELSPIDGEPLIVKRSMSAFYGTDLEILLRRHGVRTLVLAGTLTHACVLHTAFDARARDFDVIVAREATSTWAEGIEQSVFELMDLIIGRVVSVDDICRVVAAASEGDVR